MSVSDIMSSPVYVIGPDEPVSHARNLMFRHKISTLVVVENEEMVGIVTKSDMSHRLAQAEPMWRRRPIDKVPIKMIMTDEPITIYPEASISQAANLMLENRIENLPVIKNGVKGIVTVMDIVTHISKQDMATKISEISTDELVTVNRHHTIDHVIDELEKNHASKVIVTNDPGDAVGMISTRDIALTIMKNNEGDLPSKNIKMARRPTSGGEKTYRYVKDVPLIAEDIMVELSGIVNINDTVVNAAKIMSKDNFTDLPVEDNGMIVGVLSRRDVTQAK
ncbi:MAG: CBS domain-containing protein [Euryarchaeota archaeon]|nr:CBS domain-containing protein [Euryarchaeota archaeon]